MKLMISDSSRKPLSLTQLMLISKVTKREPHLSYRPVALLQKNARNGGIFVAWDGDDMIGWIESYHIWSNWWGLSTLYVFPRFRDSGVGRGKLLPTAIKNLDGRRIYAATTNPIIQKFLPTQGFKEVQFSMYPKMLIATIAWQRYKNPLTWIKLLHLAKNSFKYFAKYE